MLFKSDWKRFFMDTNYLHQYFKHLQDTCPELTATDLEKYSEGLTMSALNQNHIYIEAGEVQQQAGFVIKGLMREFYIDELGNEKNMNFIAENDYAFHYPTFMDKEPSPFSYQCIEPTIIINLPINHIHNAYKNIPKFQKYGRLRTERRAQLQRERLQSLLSKNAEQRYIDFIEQYPQLLQRITVSHLCSYLGVERQTLTRIRKQLSEKQ